MMWVMRPRPGRDAQGQFGDSLMTYLAVNFDLFFIVGPALGYGAVAVYKLIQRIYRLRFEPPVFKYQANYSVLQLTGIQNGIDRCVKVRTDRTYLYEEIALRLHRWVLAHPSPEFAVENGAAQVDGAGRRLTA
jgi:hypothetical protein